ncbi:putative RNA methyltransferase [Spirochaetia bacterium]|nr:putative RNA methyltransferase [Spirochaetia bacterium]
MINQHALWLNFFFPNAILTGMAMGEIFTAPVEQIGAGGAGIARREGKPVFIGLTAPGDLVAARIVREHPDWAQGELVELIEPSPKRISPACPLYGTCGGCALQHLNYQDQVEAKAAILRDAFIRIGGFREVPEIEAHPGPPWEYRNRVQFHGISRTHANKKSRPVLQNRPAPGKKSPVGFKSRKGEELIPIPDCPIADPGIRELLRTGAVYPPPDRDRFTLYSHKGLILQEGQQTRGRVHIRGRELLMDAGVFFQSNALMLEELIGDLLKIAGQADRARPMADIYCGVGTFTFFLGDSFPRVDLVEENKTALALARENVRGEANGYFALTDDAWVKMKEGSRQTEPYGLIVIDPPRQGLSPAMRRWLAHPGGLSSAYPADTPPLIAYVSCDPATLARDSRELLAGGYELAELGFYDFYPQTAHIESLALFKKKGGRG